MTYIYDTILYHPLLNTLVFLYNTVAFQDMGWAIIFLTLLIRVVLFPLFHKSTRHQALMQRLQPHVKKIQETHKGNREKQTQATMALYKEHGTNPFSGFLFLFIQIPILIALFQITQNSLKPEFLSGLYSFVTPPSSINHLFLGLINLAKPNILIVGLSALAQYFQAKSALPKPVAGQVPTQTEKVGKQMVFLGPVITLFIFYNFPAAVSLYWLITSAFSIVQQIIINKQLDNKQPENGSR